MSRINTNVTSLVAQRVLGQNNFGLNDSLERLSTGLRINRGKDDPAGLIASENLRAEIKSVGAAINNAERAERVVNIAEGGLSEVSGLLTELQGLITNSANEAGLSGAEKEANQLQIDSILQTIDRVADQTSFQGTKLLNGNFDFRVSSQATGIDDLRVNGAKFDGDSLDVSVLVTQSAQQAGMFLSFGGTALDLGGAGATDGASSTFVIEVAGSKGTREFSFASGTTVDQIQDTINTFSDVLGESGLDPVVSMAFAKVVVEAYEPTEIYQPIWSALGNEGDVDLDALRKADWTPLRREFPELSGTLPPDLEPTRQVPVKPRAKPPTTEGPDEGDD